MKDFKNQILPLLFIVLFMNDTKCVNLDSLISRLDSKMHDTDRVLLLDLISYNYSGKDPNIGIEYAIKAKKLSESIKWERGQALAYNEMAINQTALSENDAAIDNYFRALRIFRKIKNQNGEASVLSNISLIYKSKGDYINALRYAINALKIYEKTQNHNSKAITLENIGTIHLENKDYEKSLFYYNLSREHYLKVNDSNGLARNHLNTAIVLDNFGRYEEALKSHFESLKINESLGRTSSIQLNLANIGIVYLHLKSFDKALEYQNRALEMSTKMGNMHSIAIDKGNIGETYLTRYKHLSRKKSDLNMAIEYLKSGFEMCEELNFAPPQIEFGFHLVEALELAAQYKNAIEIFRRTENLRDSIYSTDNMVKLAKIESKQELDKKEHQLQIEKSENRIARLDLLKHRDEKIILLLGIFILFLILTVLYLLYNERIRVHKKTLYEISQFQSHQLRSPVVKIQALVHEFNNSKDIVNEEDKLHLEMLNKSIEELDQVIRTIVEKTTQKKTPN